MTDVCVIPFPLNGETAKIETNALIIEFVKALAREQARKDHAEETTLKMKVPMPIALD